MEVEITGLTRVDNPRPTKGGDVIVAFFNFRADFVTMQGAALVRLASDGFTTWEPLKESDRLPRRSVKMAGAVRREVAQAALPLFAAMGGDVGAGGVRIAAAS